MSEWKPIETAPKTGARVLLFAPPSVMVVAYWSNRQWWIAEPGAYAEDCDISPDPTHWMSLPEPPNA